MRQRVLILTLALCFASALGIAAERQYGMAGCGLGSIVMGKDGGQISAATTNGTFESQLFGMTSGISNCEPDEEGKTTISIGQQTFIKKNLASLEKEVAQGNGETLVALSEALGCTKEVQPQFNAEMQNSYSEIFSSPGAIAVLDATKAKIKENTALASSCRYLSI